MEASTPLASHFRDWSLSAVSLGHKRFAVSIQFKCHQFFLRPALLSCKYKVNPSVRWAWGNQMLTESTNTQAGCFLVAATFSPLEWSGLCSTHDPAEIQDTALRVTDFVCFTGTWPVRFRKRPWCGSMRFMISTSSSGSSISSSLDTPGFVQKGSIQSEESNMKRASSCFKTGNLDVDEIKVYNKEEVRVLELNEEGDEWDAKLENGYLDDTTEESMPSHQDFQSHVPREREILRRRRISNAKRGNAPWNKGRHHSKETRELIRSRVIEAMKDPKVREKLRAQAARMKSSPEVQLKIKAGRRRAWDLKRRLRAMQDFLLMEWEEVIAESARVGYGSDIVYQWDSYATIMKQLKGAYRRKQQKKVPVPRGSMSQDHKMRISEAIKAKWADPNYRTNVMNGNALRKHCMRSRRANKTVPTVANSEENCVTIAKDHEENRLSPSYPNEKENKIFSGDRKEENVALKGINNEVTVGDKRFIAYKDPETPRKLERLKLIRARRQSLEEQAHKHRETTQRARVLIAKAEKAAKALEAAALKDKNALAPLLETRRLLAEATRSIESTNLHSHDADAESYNS